jgi:hypothetical protein
MKGSRQSSVVSRQSYGQAPKRKTPGYGASTPSAAGAFDRPRVRAAKRRPLPHGPSILRERRAVARAGPFTVQGQSASDLEDRVYRTLRRLGWDDSEIDFQYPIFGGFQPGGQVLDFVLTAFGRLTIVAVNGDYWHNRTLQQRERDRADQAAVERAFPGRPYTFLSLSSGDLVDDETAYRINRARVGRGG